MNRGTCELCLTYRCNVQCANCSNLCTQAPFVGDLTVNDVQRFLDEGHLWGMITLHGGEPVLNPQSKEICAMLAEYKKKVNPEVTLWLLSNNSTPEIRKRITFVNTEYDIPLGISTKIGTNRNGAGSDIPYVPVNLSPEDCGAEWKRDGCFQHYNCGVCFNYLGYFPCSPMAAAARVFGYAGCRTMAEMTDERILEMFSLHCRHCGFGFAEERARVVMQVTSATWEKKLHEYTINHS